MAAMSDQARDPFPREAFSALIHRLPAYGRLAWRLGRDPLLSRARRAAVLGGAAYLVSPIDLVPGFVPVLGQLDDVAVVLASLRFALDGLSPTRRHAHLTAVGLADEDLVTDLRAIGSTGAWVGRTGLRTGRRIGVAGAVAIGRGSRRLGGATLRGAGSLAARRPRRGPRDASDRPGSHSSD
jgi:uncharacterized membrane protein YkvA (DUF1232 family)